MDRLDRLDGFLWPGERLYELLHRLAEHAGLARPGAEVETPAIATTAFADSLALAARQLGIEPHGVDMPLDRLDSELPRAAPAVMRIDREGRVLLVAVVGGSGRQLTVIGRDGETFRVAPAALRAALRGQAEATAHGHAAQSIAAPRHSAARARLLELARSTAESGQAVRVWQLRPSGGASLWRQLAAARLHRTAAALGALHVLRLLLFALSWWILGRGALSGALDDGVLLGWALVLGTLVGVTAAADWVQGHLLLDINLRYRRKIMHGATVIAPHVSRSMGSGQLLGRVFETEALDTLVMNAGLSGVTAAIDVIFSVALFLVIPGAEILALVFAGWLALVVAGGGWLYRLQRSWTFDRIAMTEEVVEGLLGRQTRLAQLGPARFHPAEDRVLERYVAASARVDRGEASFEAIAGRGWLVVGLVALAMMAGVGPLSPGAIAAAVGAVLLGFQALTRVAGSVHLAAAAVISWRQARVLYRASAEPELVGVPGLVEAEREATAAGPIRDPLVQARRLGHTPQPDREPVIDGVSLSIGARDRILLAGPSGGGKSTLARLLSGLEQATTGTVSLRGLDRGALGAHEWARRIAYVPPFSDNHVFSASLLYNLLPGSWPPSADQVDLAERVCHELGLGPLLARMPGHLQQTVGETGWRLSHGERARLFVARAVLQRSELVILDESFGALDAATMKECMDCALRRCPALVLISHV
jgi:ATP-binding cassette, subfamily B, bacterial